MGSNVQEILQGRGDQKRQGYRLVRFLPLVFLLALWAGLLLDLPVRLPRVWFPAALAGVVLCSVLHFMSARRKFSHEFLVSGALLLQGLIQTSGFPFLRLVFVPAIIALTAWYDMAVVIPLAVSVPLLGARAFLSPGALLPEAVFAVVLIAASSLASVIVHGSRREREKAVSTLSSLKQNAKSMSVGAEMQSLKDDELLTHYFASVLKTDEEIRELLVTIREAVMADAAHLFIPTPDRYSLRCSTQDQELIISGKGVVSHCLREKKAYANPDLPASVDPGYLKPAKIRSLCSVPVLESGRAAGVLVVDSARFQAFNDAEQKMVKTFAGHLAKILERERIYLHIKRDVFSMNVLKEESAKLVSSLNSEAMVRKLCEGAEKIAPSWVFFFREHEGAFVLTFSNDEISRPKKVTSSIESTLLHMALENKHQMYFPDVTKYPIPVVPLKMTETVRAALIIPMLYENRVLGIFAMLSAEKGFLDASQITVLNVFCNQAATSLANARLHEEIEKLATTDGLTGLFNHRVFQERMTAELKRMQRSTEPISLFLTDIDYFKKVNDTHGHPVGDVVLKGVAKLIQANIREIDIAARYGGEEFAVILPGTGRTEAKQIAERLREEVQKQKFNSGVQEFGVTISVGIATCPLDAKTKEDLIEKADQALYYAKRSGRNRSVLSAEVK